MWGLGEKEGRNIKEIGTKASIQKVGHKLKESKKGTVLVHNKETLKPAKA